VVGRERLVAPARNSVRALRRIPPAVLEPQADPAGPLRWGRERHRRRRSPGRPPVGRRVHRGPVRAGRVRLRVRAHRGTVGRTLDPVRRGLAHPQAEGRTGWRDHLRRSAGPGVGRERRAVPGRRFARAVRRILPGAQQGRAVQVLRVVRGCRVVGCRVRVCRVGRGCRVVGCRVRVVRVGRGCRVVGCLVRVVRGCRVVGCRVRVVRGCRVVGCLVRVCRVVAQVQVLVQVLVPVPEPEPARVVAAVGHHRPREEVVVAPPRPCRGPRARPPTNRRPRPRGGSRVANGGCSWVSSRHDPQAKPLTSSKNDVETES